MALCRPSGGSHNPHLAGAMGSIWYRLGMLIASAATLSSCAIGNVGTLAAKLEQCGDLSVLSVFSAGIHLRTHPDDFGADLGYSRRRYTFVSDVAPSEGWYFFRLPSPDLHTIAQDLTTFGIEIAAVTPIKGIALGYSHNLLLARVPADESVYIEYSGSERRVVKFNYFGKEYSCRLELPLR